MKSQSSPQDLQPVFPLSSLPSLFEAGYGVEMAKAAKNYSEDKCALGIRELAHELRTTLTSLNGATSRLSVDSDLSVLAGQAHRQNLRQNVSALHHLAIQLNEFTAPRKKVVYTIESMKEIIVEACQSTSSSLSVGEANCGGFKCDGKDFRVEIGRHHLQKTLTCLFRCFTSASRRQKAAKLIHIHFQKCKKEAIISMHVENGESLEVQEIRQSVEKLYLSRKPNLVGLNIAANYVANLNGHLLLAIRRSSILKALIRVPLRKPISIA